MRHIVIDARQYSTTSGRYIRELLVKLEELDKENRYSILLSKKDFDSYQPINTNFQKVLAPFAQFSYAEQFQLLGLIKKLKPDLVHFSFVQQPLLYFGNKVTTIHDLTPLRFKSRGLNSFSYQFKKTLYWIMVKMAILSSKKILTPSKFVKTDLIKLTRKAKNKTTVTYEAGINASSKKTMYKPMQNKKYIIYVGRAAVHKNLRNLVESFRLLQLDHPKLNLVLVGGDRNYQELKDYVAKRNILNIHFTGFVSDHELNWLYSKALAYVFPSLSEGFGLPGLEAIAHSAPVISSNASCLPEIYGDAALYFNPRDPEDIALKIERVLNDKEYRKQLIENGHKQLSKYSWEKTAKETLEIYNQLLK